MENIYPCCAGLDVHKESVEACVRRMGPNGRLDQQTRHWGTMTRDLLAMSDWMAAQGVTHVAMESTGVYWKPIYNILESRFAVLLVNARHLKQVPGRKSDVRDCQWIAQLLQHGLLKPSFIPPQAQRELRDLTRHRTQLAEERTRTVNRLHKVLEDANIKLASVATDILGVSGRAMLSALMAGQERGITHLANNAPFDKLSASALIRPTLGLALPLGPKSSVKLFFRDFERVNQALAERSAGPQ